MFELLRLAIALVGTLAAGLWDLRTTDVPDRVVFSMIALGLALAAAEGYLSGDWTALAYSLMVSLAFTAFAALMYYAGAWGGGDGALLVAVGALLPTWIFAGPLSFLPFPLVYFISVFAVGLLYSTTYLSVKVLRDRKAAALFGREFAKIRLAYVPVAVVLLLLVPMLPALLSFLLALFLLILPPVYALSNAADRFFYKRVVVRDLQPGDMIGEDLPRLKIYKSLIRGLTPKEVAAIRKLKKSVVVRSGVRYAVVFFLALLVLLLVSALL